MEQKNPYTGILDVMEESAKGAKTTAYVTGEVVSASPLVVRANGVEIEAEAMRVNPMLRKGYKRKLKASIPAHTISGAISATGVSGDCTINVSTQTISGIEITLTEDELKVGDLVLMIPTDDMQTYHLICRAEDASE